MDDRWTYTLTAENHHRASENKIHDDPVAKAYGFKGGLVPGVDVFAYFAHLPAREWGLSWVESGRLETSFRSPVYDGELVTVTRADDQDGGPGDPVELVLHNAEGAACATGTAEERSGTDLPDPKDWPDADPSSVGSDASPESLTVGTALGPIATGFHADRAGDYLAEIGETLPLFIDEGVAHPGWLLRFANFVLATHVRLGPWIHVSSDVSSLGLVRDGEQVETRAVVTDESERKGHRFVVLDVLVTADGRPVQRTTHTAIHTLRPAQTQPGAGKAT